jgi:threonine/homoserine/homoserine lactone efflux protein
MVVFFWDAFMPHSTTLVTFGLISLGMVLAPGPNMIYLANEIG